ncbi:MAG: ATP synthase F1 subunit delta [Phycisphaerales bacterium]|nr:ATP synthase F1 subunit delta [Phycisphaerales bacterium]
MPLSTAAPDALAAIYAKSLFELAEAHGGPQAVAQCLDELEAVLEIARADARFSEFLSSRVLPREKREDSLKKILSGRVSDLTLRFLLVLNDKERLARLPAIAGAYDRVVQDRFGRVEVDVFTATPVSADELRSIRDRLASILGKEIIVHPYTDPAMIGGVRMRIGDQLIDGSIATRLRRMRDQLATDGAVAVRSKASRIIGN